MDDVLYGLDRGSMMPTLMGSPVFAGSTFAGSSAEARYMPLVAPSARRASSPDASAPPVSAESCRNRLREIPLMRASFAGLHIGARRSLRRTWEPSTTPFGGFTSDFQCELIAGNA